MQFGRSAFFACCVIQGCFGAAVTIGPTGPMLYVPGASTAILKGLQYIAADVNNNTCFQTGAATLLADGVTLTYAISPPTNALTVTAKISPAAEGVILDFTVSTSANFPTNCGFGGFILNLPATPTAARLGNALTWGPPAHSPTDALYPDSEYQVREMDLPGATLAWVSSYADLNWFFGKDLTSTDISNFPPPKPGMSASVHMGLFVVGPNGQDVTRLAAEAAGRPLALTLTTSNLGNLYEPGQRVPLTANIFNVTNQSTPASLNVQVYDYQGNQLLSSNQTVTVAPLSSQSISLPFTPPSRGVAFATAALTSLGQLPVLTRTNVGVLPTKPSTGLINSSPFGIAGVPANPSWYPDQANFSDMLTMMQRIGIRWARNDWFHLRSQGLPFDATAFDHTAVSNRIMLLTQSGILPYEQLTSPAQGAPQNPAAFTQDLQYGIGKFHDIPFVTDHLEVGNELNANPSPDPLSSTAAAYIDNYLVPQKMVTQSMFPNVQVSSMGFDGFWPDSTMLSPKSPFTWSYPDFVNARGMDDIAVLSIHPGSYPRAPEHWTGSRGFNFRPQVQDAVQVASDNGNKEVWITEAYAPSAPNLPTVDVRTAADYMVRTYVTAIASGVKHVFWYTITDGNGFDQAERTDNIDNNFGILYSDLTPKPAYVAFSAMTEQLEGATFQGRLDVGGADDLYGARFSTASGNVDVLWSYREKNELDVDVPDGQQPPPRLPGQPWRDRWLHPAVVTSPASASVIVTDIMGNATQLTPNSQGMIVLKLTGSPVYVRGLGSPLTKSNLWGSLPAIKDPPVAPDGYNSFCTFLLPQTSAQVPATAYTYSFTVGSSPPSSPSDCGFPPVVASGDWLTVTSDGSTVTYSVAANLTGTTRTGQIALGVQTFTVTQAANPASLQFVPVRPCRIMDTRLNGAGIMGWPSLIAGETRTIPVTSGTCNIALSAQAYSLNITAIPKRGTLAFLTVWPTGQPQPLVSTLNSEDGLTLANGAIVLAGINGSISAFATDDTDLVIDISGYFTPPSANTLQFYPLAPCRVLDTRNAAGLFGGPAIAGGTTRSYAIPAANCGAPTTASAYSLNVTVVPVHGLGYLTAWPLGQPQPVVSTLNAGDDRILANAAIVPAGSGGAVNFFATDTTDLVVDINGYFAPPGSAGLNFFPVSPCRVIDTRNALGPLGGPIIAGDTSRTFPLPQGPCNLPPSVAAYSLNMTVVPTGGLAYLATWPAGQTKPLVSTLNDAIGLPIANAAIVPAGSNGAISVYVTNDTHVIVDASGYFGH